MLSLSRREASRGVVAKCKSDNPEHHQDSSSYYHYMRKFHRVRTHLLPVKSRAIDARRTPP